ncbi:hypothetical protein [Thiomicrospira sp. S5]|uniref:hypothetical protein n=1 Tax=Thiomicrospira sp. S5 TaxID=1803865 RepID=UPI000F8E7B50|nr:hypothetical protein [Thiomicrospira sp. S5]
MSVESKRPFQLQAMCANREPQQVIQFVGLVYQLCSQAQTFASQLALLPMSSLSLNEMQRAVTVEALKEHYLTLIQLLRHFQICDASETGRLLQGVGQWQIKLENKKLLAGLIVDAYAKCGIDLCRVSGAIVLPGSWAEKLMERLFRIEESTFCFNQASLPPGLHGFLSGEKANGLIEIERREWQEWVKSPACERRVYENSAFSRIEAENESADFITGLPMTDRVQAKWFDAAAFWRSFESEKNEYGRLVFGVNRSEEVCQSWVETARGRLYHSAYVVSGKVKDYAICAPTEWNFHPEGLAKKMLSELSSQVSDAELWKECATLCAQVVDPCVPVRFVT